jgi:hypothetical protein
MTLNFPNASRTTPQNTSSGFGDMMGARGLVFYRGWAVRQIASASKVACLKVFDVNRERIPGPRAASN